MTDQEQDLENVQGYKDDDILQQFQTADGGTIVLSSEQIAQMQQGMEEQQHYVEEIIGGDPNVEVHHRDDGDPNMEGMETQQIHLDADGNAHIVTQGQIGDLVTFHAVGVDSQGNYVGQHEAEEEEEEGEEEDGDVGVELDHDEHGGIEQMMEADNVVEEVITPNNQEEAYLGGDGLEMEVGQDINQQFNQYQVFNPDTGTFSQVQAPVVQQQQQQKTILRRPVQKVQTQQQFKYVITQPSADGQNQQIVLDANSLQGLIQGGAFSLDGSGGKQLILSQQHSPPKPKQIMPTTRSPAKILPAPLPVGDQQQAGTKKIVYMQGGNIMSTGDTKFITTGSGNQLQFVRVIQKGTGNKIPIAPATLKPRPVAPKPGPGTFILPAGTSAADIASIQNTTGLGNVVVLPNYLLQKDQQSLRHSDSGSILTDSNSIMSGLGSSLATAGNLDSFRSLLEPNGMRPRKPCNCTKSQCLKLYCDCFANGEFCHLCNCTNCFNNLNHEEDRQKAIKLVLERNPGAFRPKIGKSSMTGEAHERRHNKGCNCRRSGCLKNYCECYEAKIFCSSICKCTGCKNCIENIPSGLPNGVGVEQHFAGAGTAHRQTLKDLAEAAEVRVQQQNQVKNKMRAQMQEVSPQNNLGIMVPPIVFRYPHGSISYEVITSTVELLLAKAEAGEKQKLNQGEIERLVLDEFSECLASIMDLGTSIDRHWP
ncbi:protein lin-54 homolog isoform X2 [Folsomia candida]|uniref:protein lin-54 homolog isoform X2 n=1 Tax=Folsomia candida TaxID=158441 RepID=UPI000B8F238F|nr:protein lin-54 homolog isoform X2 [Folsomia candida]